MNFFSCMHLEIPPVFCLEVYIVHQSRVLLCNLTFLFYFRVICSIFWFVMFEISPRCSECNYIFIFFLFRMASNNVSLQPGYDQSKPVQYKQHFVIFSKISIDKIIIIDTIISLTVSHFDLRTSLLNFERQRFLRCMNCLLTFSVLLCRLSSACFEEMA